MSQLLIKIVAIGTKKFILQSILYGGNHSPNSCFQHIQHTHEIYYATKVIIVSK
jgi:hypothetical protein